MVFRTAILTEESMLLKDCQLTLPIMSLQKKMERNDEEEEANDKITCFLGKCNNYVHRISCFLFKYTRQIIHFPPYCELFCFKSTLLA